MRQRSQRILAGIVLVGAALIAGGCGGAGERVPVEDAAAEVAVETVSLKIEGMT